MMVEKQKQFFQYSRNVFSFFGLWGDVGKTKTFKAIFIKYAVVVGLGIVIPIISITETMAAARKGDIPLSFSKALFGFGYLVCYHKLAAAALNGKEIYSCIIQLEEMSLKFKDLTDFNSSLKTYKSMATIGTVANNICGVFFVVAPLVQRDLPYNPQIAHFDFSKSPYFEVMYAYEAVATIVISNAMLAYDAVVFLLGLIIPIICITDTMASIEQGDVTLTLVKALYGFAFLVCWHKLAAAALNSRDIYSCISQLEWMSLKCKDLTDFESGHNTYKKMATIGTVANNVCGLFFVIAPLVQRQFPYNPHIAHFDFSKSPYYEIMYMYQAAAVLIITNTMLAYDALFCGLMRLSAGVLASISREIREINENMKESETKLMEVIEKMVEISSLIDKISDTFSFTTMTSILYNCNLMALGLFMVSFLPFTDLTCIAMISVIFVETFQLWIYCYFGQVIVNEKQLLQTELYCTHWYNGSKNFKSMVLLTIFEAQNDRYVTAGRILQLSLSTFTEVLKKAYAFYTFMKKTR